MNTTTILISLLFLFIFGIYFIVLIISLYRNEKRKEREFDVKRYTFEICSVQMQSICKCFNKLEDFDNVLLIFNVFESLSVGVYSEVLSGEVVKLYCGKDMKKFYECNHYMLFKIRENKNDASLYSTYERFMEEWKTHDGLYKVRKGK